MDHGEAHVAAVAVVDQRLHRVEHRRDRRTAQVDGHEVGQRARPDPPEVVAAERVGVGGRRRVEYVGRGRRVGAPVPTLPSAAANFSSSTMSQLKPSVPSPTRTPASRKATDGETTASFALREAQCTTVIPALAASSRSSSGR